MNRKYKAWRILPLIALLAIVLTGCGEPYLSAINPQGAVAEQQYGLLKLTTYIMTFVVLVVAALFVIILVRFREKPGQTGYPKQVEGSLKLEILWTVIPMILLAIIAVPTVQQTFSLAEEYPESETEDALRVNVTAYLYWWKFEYPDLGIVTAQDLVVPANKRVYFELTSQDVIHSFWIPALGGKMDTNPMMINKFYLDTTEQAGVYYGKCAELCGPSHALMDFKTVVVDSGQFDTWVANMQNAKDEPSTELAQLGRDVYQQNACFACHAIAGEGGSTAPDLTGFAERERVAGILKMGPENVQKWLTDPQQVKQGAKMPPYGHLSEEDMNALVEYLMDQKLNK